MAHIGQKPDEFDAATNVMESGLLRTLTQASSTEVKRADAEVVVDDTVETELPPPRPIVVLPTAARRPRKSRFFVVAGIITMALLAFDAWLVIHHRGTPRSAETATRSEPLPKYMLVPIEAPLPPVVPAPAPPPQMIAEATPPPSPSAHAHRRSHHQHRH